MNKKIRKLAEQSGFYFYDLHDIDGQDLGETIEADSWNVAEKFAELIVLECIRRCEGNGEYKNHTDTDWGKGLEAGIEMCKTTIQTTFWS